MYVYKNIVLLNENIDSWKSDIRKLNLERSEVNIIVKVFYIS